MKNELNKCCAITKKGTRCCRNSATNHKYCRIHIKSLNTERKKPYKISTSIKLIDITKPINYKCTTKQMLKNTLEFYNVPISNDIKNKIELYNLLFKFVSCIYIYKKYESHIILLQTYYRKYLKNKLESLRIENIKGLGKVINDLDFYTLEKIKNKYIYYINDNNAVYSFDIRSLYKLVYINPENPYNKTLFTTQQIDNIKKYVKYLSLNNINLDFTQPSNNNYTINTPELLVKRRTIKLFLEMDNLDQYTNPSWFLDLDFKSLIKLYKETEDIWNWRLGLNDEQRRKIYREPKKLFPISTKNISKIIKTKVELQNICLDFIEKLITDAEDKNDRVNGCMYVLLGFVIVNKQAADAMPSYYTMVSNDLSSANYIDILI